MNITEEQLAQKPKKIGKLGSRTVIEVVCKGGFHMVIVPSDKTANGFETLGTGSHKAIARHIAEVKNPEIVYTELAKADHVPVEHFALMLPKWVRVTDEIRKAQGL